VFLAQRKSGRFRGVTLETSTFRITFAGLRRQRHAIFSFSSLLFSSLQLSSS
jgi:hypothetical protein